MTTLAQIRRENEISRRAFEARNLLPYEPPAEVADADLDASYTSGYDTGHGDGYYGRDVPRGLRFRSPAEERAWWRGYTLGRGDGHKAMLDEVRETALRRGPARAAAGLDDNREFIEGED